MSNASIIKGSLSDIAKRNNMSLAESFLNVDYVVICDTSGSMNTTDSGMEETRYNRLISELASLQSQFEGKFAIINFSTDVEYVPGGKPAYMGRSTNLAKALQFARIADVEGITFYLLSDGYPDNPTISIEEAKKFKNTIHVIHIAGEDDWKGRDFLIQLADATGGKFQNVSVKEVSKTIRMLTG